MTDKTLVCRDCGSEFVFSVGEQDFYPYLKYEGNRYLFFCDLELATEREK